ncbi:hypothetical protein [Paraburkholderia bannensis]|uniref:hypothetical protein n=1 Tax=Paraburkholderia bannensis TaxID=765414 RepID=UPI002AC34840|nr:hypothetical protein [Paraburkholderia bannensis]
MRPAILHEGEIVDGRRRVDQAIEHGLVCTFVAYDSERLGHPAIFVATAANLVMRVPQSHCRALIAAAITRLVESDRASLALYVQADPAKGARSKHTSARLLAACSVSFRSFERALAIDDERVLRAAWDGDISLEDGAKCCKLPDLRRRHRLLDAPTREKRHTAIRNAYDALTSKRQEQLPLRLGAENLITLNFDNEIDLANAELAARGRVSQPARASRTPGDGDEK